MQNTGTRIITKDTDVLAGYQFFSIEEEGDGHLVGAGRSADIGEGENVKSAAGLEPWAPLYRVAALEV
jgi:hypothetical protein